MKYIYIIISVVVLSLFGCDSLDQSPKDAIDPKDFLKTEEDLRLYTNWLYRYLPDGKSVFKGDEESDYAAPQSLSRYYLGDFTPADASAWEWANLKHINYFLERYDKPELSQEVKNHYGGLVHLTRALFYYEKVKKYGDVPWLDKTLASDSPELYNPRDPREVVMAHVLEDLNFACQNMREISVTNNQSSSLLTRWVALAMKSRICLFEGTYRKYHTYLNLQNTADEWLQEAADAAEELMEKGPYSLYDALGPEASYRALFINEKPVNKEVILAAEYNNELKMWHDANWWYTSGTYGKRLSLTKTFINTYLNQDGTRFTDKDNYNQIEFADEVAGRDPRLSQTIRMEGYTRRGNPVSVDFGSNNTGYQPIKWLLDDELNLDGRGENYNSVPIIRFAEVLLNYAEAKAELGAFTEADWSKSIGLLRKRAGIENTDMPTTADTYLQKEFFPRISNAVLLEIRRERGIELVLEGNRYDDIRRWRAGDLMTKPYLGLYVPALNVEYDLNKDGKPDVCFVTSGSGSTPGVIYYRISSGAGTALTNGTSGNLIWLSNTTRYYEDKQYLYPIASEDITLNPNLKQNPGW